MIKQVNVVGILPLKNGELKVWFDNGEIKYFDNEEELERYKNERKD